MAGIGHNSDETDGEASYRVTSNELRQFVERIERLNAEQKDIQEQRKEILAEAKARGYDVAVLRKVVKDRQKNPEALAEFEAVQSMYREALGLLV